MDNQPTPQSQPIPPQPPVPSPSSQPTTPVVPPTPVAPSVPPLPVAQPAPSTPPTPTKKKFGLGKVILVCFILALLIGGGVGATFIVMATQPSSIMASAINNLITADHISVDGEVDIVYSSASSSDPVKINLKMLGAGADHSSTVQVLADPSLFGVSDLPVVLLELDEMVVDNGNIYFRVKGVYDAMFAVDSLMGNLFTSGTYTPSDKTLSIIQQISDYAENRWFVVSIEEVVNSPMLTMDAQSRQEYLDGYNCAKDKLNNLSSYSSEFSDLYKNHPFINMEQQADSFYGISLNTTHLAAYANEVPTTKLSKDLMACANTSIDTSSITTTSEDFDYLQNHFPTISAKIEGFLDYHLTELKVSSTEDNYSISSDIKFDYNTPVDISAPSDATSILDAVTHISNIISSASSTSQSLDTTSSIETTTVVESTN